MFIDKHQAAKITGISPQTLKRMRLDGRLIEGVHWVAVNRLLVRYNKLLLEDWISSQGHPERHQAAIESFLASLLSNQPRRAGRKAKTPKNAA